MERHGGAWLKRANARTTRAFIELSLIVVSAVAFPVVVAGNPSPELQEERTPSAVMLILRGIASPEYPRGQLDGVVIECRVDARLFRSGATGLALLHEVLFRPVFVLRVEPLRIGLTSLPNLSDARRAHRVPGV